MAGKRIVSGLINNINRLFGLIGMKFVKLESVPGYHRFQLLPSINTVIDVGVGHEGSPFLYDNFPNAFFISIDPLRESKGAVDKQLDQNQNIFVEAALGSTTSRIQIGVSQMLSMTSILRRRYDDDNSAVFETRDVLVQRLDDLINKLKNEEGLKIERPVLLKVDTEGYELEVLKGAEKVLNEIDYVMLEIPLAEHVLGSYTFCEIINLMDQKGFTVFQTIDAAIDLMDILFVRKDDEIRNKIVYGAS